MNSPLAPSRRDVLKLGGVAAGSLTLGIALPLAGRFGAAVAAEASSGAPKWQPTDFVRIDRDESITVVSSKSEMGQGIYTSLAMLIAEELDCDWDKIKVVSAPVAHVYDSPFLPVQFTGGSTSTQTTYDQYRIIGATARTMLVAAAAKTWNVAAETCRAERGFVIGAGGQRLSYGQLVDTAAGLPLPGSVSLKPRAGFAVIGKPRGRVDGAEKIAGKAQFASDVRLPGMLTALVLRCPVYGGKAVHIDSARAAAMRGVRAIMPVPTGVAVVADGFWQAHQARDALKVTWDEGHHAHLDTEALTRQFGVIAEFPGVIVRKDGNPGAALAGAAKTITAQYEQPYLAHAPMEPMSCVVDLKDDSCEIWIGTESQSIDRDMVAKVTGLAPERINLHTTYLGGAFGRRLQFGGADWLREAVEIAKVVKPRAPIKLLWTREDDMTGAYYRPLWVDHISGGLDANGRPVAWMQTGVGQSIIAGTALEYLLMRNGIDRFSVEGADDLPYAIDNVQFDVHTPRVDYPVNFWRSVGHSHNAFVKEAFIDELAGAAGKDPVSFRRTLLAKQPRQRAVLDLAAAKAGWDQAPAAGHFRGVALHHSFNSSVAQVIEIAVDGKTVKVERVVCAIDCGMTVNPDQIVAQMESGIVFGLSAAMFGEITLKKGRVAQTNFDSYDVVRMCQAPRIEVHIVESSERPGGVGEPGTPPAAPALVNALFAATGRRFRSLPLTRHGFEFP